MIARISSSKAEPTVEGIDSYRSKCEMSAAQWYVSLTVLPVTLVCTSEEFMSKM